MAAGNIKIAAGNSKIAAVTLKQGAKNEENGLLEDIQTAINVLFGPGSLAAFWLKTLDIGGPNPPGPVCI